MKLLFDFGFPASYSYQHSNKYTVSERHRITLTNTFRVSINPFEYRMVMTDSCIYGINLPNFVVRNKVKVDLFLSLINHGVTKTDRGMEVCLHAFSITTLDEVEW